MVEKEQEQAAVFACVCASDKCPKGGEHEWGDELVQLDEHSASVVCKKCGIDQMSVDMWKDFP